MNIEPIVIIDTVEVTKEDGGKALIAHLESDDVDCLFVRLQSWDEEKYHPMMNALIGKKVKITIEVVDE